MDTILQECLEHRIRTLKTLVTNSSNEMKRVESIYLLKEVARKDDLFFKFIENLLISDSNPTIRYITLKIIKEHYLDRAFEPLCWAYKHETSLECILQIISIFGEMNTHLSCEYLGHELRNIKISEFYSYVMNMMDKGESKTLDGAEMAKILTQYHIIKNFLAQFELIRYKIEKGRIIDLDFSFVYHNGFTTSIIAQLPKIIRNLKGLRSLNLKYNKLKEFPRFIKYLTRLKYLDLSNNQISEIPTNITELNSLTHLDLSWNNLQYIPDEILHLSNLKSLNVRYNRIEHAREPLSYLKKQGIQIYL
ncbi:MAG: hypothetical protein BAJALOKI1v1_1280005 [Promethearchaeota archaeon]|nr:MAG: hypothetical protein BAJALOKI1v1_1280005 [Candidatus Lokiarchaeota archaeon]